MCKRAWWVYSNLRRTNKIVGMWTIVFTVFYIKIVSKLKESIFQVNKIIGI
jgi:hypothetical protein